MIALEDDRPLAGGLMVVNQYSKGLANLRFPKKNETKALISVGRN